MFKIKYTPKVSLYTGLFMVILGLISSTCLLVFLIIYFRIESTLFLIILTLCELLFIYLITVFAKEIKSCKSIN